MTGAGGRGLGSRDPGRRPRKVASKTHPVDTSATEASEASEAAEIPASADPVEPPPTDPPRERSGAGFGGRRTSLLLAVAIVALIGVVAVEVFLLTRDDAPTVSASRPVVTGELSHRAAVEAAARSTEEILSTGFEDYDEQVEQAESKMTDTFAKEYRQTSDDIRDRFVENRTRLQVKAVGQSVVQASSEQVQALLFLDQYVEKQVDGEPATDFAQYRALVTVVRTDQGWLVSNIETQ